MLRQRLQSSSAGSRYEGTKQAAVPRAQLCPALCSSHRDVLRRDDDKNVRVIRGIFFPWKDADFSRESRRRIGAGKTSQLAPQMTTALSNNSSESHCSAAVHDGCGPIPPMRTNCSLSPHSIISRMRRTPCEEKVRQASLQTPQGERQAPSETQARGLLSSSSVRVCSHRQLERHRCENSCAHAVLHAHLRGTHTPTGIALVSPSPPHRHRTDSCTAKGGPSRDVAGTHLDFLPVLRDCRDELSDPFEEGSNTVHVHLGLEARGRRCFVSCFVSY